MSGWLSGPRGSRPLGHSAIDGGGGPFSGARVVSVAHFEPAAGMQGEALDSYKRRFGTLFVDESTRRRGGIGSVVRATNVLGEQFALKTLVFSVSRKNRGRSRPPRVRTCCGGRYRRRGSLRAGGGQGSSSRMLECGASPECRRSARCARVCR